VRRDEKLAVHWQGIRRVGTARQTSAVPKRGSVESPEQIQEQELARRGAKRRTGIPERRKPRMGGKSACGMGRGSRSATAGGQVGSTGRTEGLPRVWKTAGNKGRPAGGGEGGKQMSRP